MFRKRDLVCGVKVKKNSKYSLQYEGKTYYFDCQACKATFQETPQRYIKNKAGIGFLKWLAKGSKEVPKSCHEIRNSNS
jgi:YHS domain-containing protein